MNKTESINCGTSRVVTKAACYEKELAWEIEHFSDWWTSREMAPSGRNENTTEDEEMMDEEPTDWSKGTLSPLFRFEVEGVQHEFRIAILKFDNWDRYDDEHNEMLGVSLLYNGPCESVIVKPLFYTEQDWKTGGRPLYAEKLVKGTFSQARVYSSHSLTDSPERYNETNFNVMCFTKVYMFDDNSTIESLEENLSKFRVPVHSVIRESTSFLPEVINSKFTDYKLICIKQTKEEEEEEEVEKVFQCHRMVLATRSRFFHGIFSSQSKEFKDEFKVEDVSKETMENMLRFLYTGRVKSDQINIPLLEAANKYQIDNLKALCELELARALNDDRATNLAQVASSVGSKEFKRHVLGFVGKRWKRLKALDRTNLIKKNPELLSEILSNLKRQ